MVRTAVRQALDKKALIDVAWAGYGTEIGSFVPPTDPWFEDLTDVAPYNESAAREALIAAGVAAGTPITLDVPPINYATNSSEFIADALGKVGFDVTITPVTWEEWLDRVFTKADYDLTIVCHIERNDMAIYANPDYYFRFDNAEYRDLIENEADRLMLELYRDIYSGRLDNLQMFLLKEFFEILEKAIDRCREAGVVAYQIVLKNS